MMAAKAAPIYCRSPPRRADDQQRFPSKLGFAYAITDACLTAHTWTTGLYACGCRIAKAQHPVHPLLALPILRLIVARHFDFIASSVIDRAHSTEQLGQLGTQGIALGGYLINCLKQAKNLVGVCVLIVIIESIAQRIIIVAGCADSEGKPLEFLQIFS
uniref:Uncharacterized protein n=1 Tax=Pseudomonas fluorescens (strain SBW25) TaxID=216595 RepID=A4V7D3_PSEFS|nr:hypothetical protein pQBR0163 [Pseudomonas fluorescens SBW25]